MITFRDIGRWGYLGNQMFRYAALRGIAKIKGADWHISHSGKLTSVGNPLLENSAPGYPAPFCKERIYGYDPDWVDSLPPHVEIFGYFQSWKYFQNAQEEIRQAFDFSRHKTSVQNLSGHVSLHIRRGDYLSHSGFHHLGDDYYESAMERFPDRQFAVFTDDPHWVHLKYAYRKNMTIIHYENEALDMGAMTMCEHHIIANSTFSWWGAWLGKNPQKRVIAPRQWFDSSLGYDDKDLIPPEWERI